ncbi:carboxymuconolactone decarboxylase family protein [Actinomadura sp. KC216]|uniref:carboxymuconolactone decarboxylase family protein n=1 Tax=Actinomadura sp. KC216 TaxID=2530370 RepID=UPI00104C3423|nr:carboxymuconolactone decarboxylase family protein [Actinomadura sp. KC216]TDB87994.1 carboxymuconolactone decarboxylase family protein [Actinomadura sp. KC216]
MSHISRNPSRSGLHGALEERFQRLLGTGLNPMRAMARQPQVLETIVGLERRVTGWNALDLALKDLAVMAAAVRIGCGWCIDYSRWESVAHGIPATKVEAVPVWRNSDLFTALERLILVYAEAMTDTPPTVTDDMVQGLLCHLGEPQFIELTAVIAIENQRSRINHALRPTAQDLSPHKT